MIVIPIAAVMIVVTTVTATRVVAMPMAIASTTSTTVIATDRKASLTGKKSQPQGCDFFA